MNPGSLISCFSLFVATQLQHGQCAFPNSLLLFVQSRGVFLGACTFIATCAYTATANAPFGSSFSLRHFLSAVFVAHNRAARHVISILEKIGLARLRWVSGWSRSDWGLVACVLLACSLCLARLLALVLLLCSRLLLALAGLFLLFVQLAPFWFVFVPAGGNCFALGTGGIRWSLLVGGLGPVLSIPKLCFKPFRTL